MISIVNIFTLYIHCNTKTIKIPDFINKDFQHLIKFEFRWRQICEILIIYKPSLGSGDMCSRNKKFRPDRLSPFDVYWIETNKKTNTHPE